MSYPDAALHDTHSPEWRDICFARWICRLPHREARAEFIRRLRARHGPTVAEHLAQMVKAQWKARTEWAPHFAERDLFESARCDVKADDRPQLELAG